MAKQEKLGKEKKQGLKIAGYLVPYDYILTVLLVVFVAGYVMTKSVIFAALTLIDLVALFLKDAMPEKTDSKSVVTSVKELGFALAAALILWYGLSFLLQTSTPIDVVTSCSMLPRLDRGDLIVIQGGEIHAREIAINSSIQFKDFVKSDCKVREISSGIERLESCTNALMVNGEQIDFDKSGDVIVYEPKNAYRDVGLIVHRAVLKVNYNGATYYLIKGDNNTGPEVFGITQSLATKDQIKGREILRVPYIGYLKLFLSLQFDEPENCKYLIEDGRP
jgi:signal peptidase I